MSKIAHGTPPASFFSEEVRSGYTVSAKTKKLWSVEIDLLQCLIGVCERHHLKYWADGGTLLGAVRHQGFVPWDDDIDIIMPREDYDKLVALAVNGQEFLVPYLLQTAYTDTGYMRGHAQLRDTRTAGILPQDIFQNFNQGIFIDIFPADSVSDDQQILERQLREAHALRKELFDLGIEEDNAPLFQQYEEIFHRVTDSEKNAEYFSALAFHLNPAKKCRRAWYDQTVLLNFEYIKIPAPAGYDEVLKVYYGDYLRQQQLPPMHGKVIFDTERPAEEVLKELRWERVKLLEQQMRDFKKIIAPLRSFKNLLRRLNRKTA
jgi:lipopolysaccharide cholinephosphotransferase